MLNNPISRILCDSVFHVKSWCNFTFALVVLWNARMKWFSHLSTFLNVVPNHLTILHPGILLLQKRNHSDFYSTPGFLFHSRIFIPFEGFYSIPGFLFPSRVFIPFQDFYSRVLRLKRNHSDFYCDMVSNLLQPCIDTFVRNINSTNLNSNLILHSTMQLACSKMRLQWKRFFFSKCWTISSFILGFPLSWGW